MSLITLILINLIWISYSLSDGLIEGFYFHFRNNSRRVCEFEINRFFSLQRILVMILMAGFLVNALGWYSLTVIVCQILMFFFFHNGAYYLTRHKLDDKMYPLGWRDESRTFPVFYSGLTKYKKRAALMVLGLIIQVFIYIFLLHD
jgi:hypothetical protein